MNEENTYKLKITEPLKYFLDINKNNDDSYTLYEWNYEQKPRIYILNQYGRKLLQLILKNEPVNNAQNYFAQINIVPYSTKQYIAFNNHSPLMKKRRVYNNFKITYHGENDDNNAKIHFKTEVKNGISYKTILENTCSLELSIPRIVPLFSFFPGYLVNKRSNDKIKKQAHIFKLDNNESIRLDMYFAGKNFDFQSYLNSMYSFHMFFTPEFLVAQYNHPLLTSQIIRPVRGYIVSEYYIWIRCSKYFYQGHPYFQFYDNKDYYMNYLNREIAYKEKDGKLNWSTAFDEENRIKKERKI